MNSREPQTLANLAAEMGAKPAQRERGRTRRRRRSTADLFTDVLVSVVIIDTGNYYPRQRDGSIDAIESGMPKSQWVAQQLRRSVIKAFNNIYAARFQNFGLPTGTTGLVAIPVAGDDPKAKAIVLRLVDDIGFDAVDSGGLAESWHQQPETPI